MKNKLKNKLNLDSYDDPIQEFNGILDSNNIDYSHYLNLILGGGRDKYIRETKNRKKIGFVDEKNEDLYESPRTDDDSLSEISDTENFSDVSNDENLSQISTDENLSEISSDDLECESFEIATIQENHESESDII